MYIYIYIYVHAYILSMMSVCMCVCTYVCTYVCLSCSPLPRALNLCVLQHPKALRSGPYSRLA